MRSKKNNHGRNHGCKRPDPRYKMNLYQRNNLFKRSFNDKIYIVSMGMNTSSRSTPTSPMHNLSFTSHVRWSCSFEILSGEAPEEYDSWKLSGSHGLVKAYVQPIGASWDHIPESLEIINSSSKAEHGWESRGYNLPKALCIRGKAHKVIEYEGRCQIKSNKGSGGP